MRGYHEIGGDIRGYHVMGDGDIRRYQEISGVMRSYQELWGISRGKNQVKILTKSPKLLSLSPQKMHHFQLLITPGKRIGGSPALHTYKAGEILKDS